MVVGVAAGLELRVEPVGFDFGEELVELVLAWSVVIQLLLGVVEFAAATKLIVLLKFKYLKYLNVPKKH